MRVEIIGDADRAAHGVDASIAMGQASVGDVEKVGLGLNRPARVDKVMNAGSDLQRKFDRRTDGPLGTIFESVVVREAGARLKIWRQACIFADEVIAYQSGRTDHDMA